MRPKVNGLVELVDEKPVRNGFYCGELVRFMWNDTSVKGWDAWHGRFVQTQAGRCVYRDRCPRYKRTMEKQKRKGIQLEFISIEIKMLIFILNKLYFHGFCLQVMK